MTDRYVLPNGASIRVRNDNVLVAIEPDDVRELASGILAPGGHRKEQHAVPARVCAVGPGCWADVRVKPARRDHPVDQSPTTKGGWIPTTVLPGDRVLLDTGLAGDFLREVDGNPYRMVREAEILAVIGEGDVG